MSLLNNKKKVLILKKLCCLQVKQLRNRADEDARLIHMALQMGSEPPSSLRKDLDHLMILVSIPLHLSRTTDLTHLFSTSSLYSQEMNHIFTYCF